MANSKFLRLSLLVFKFSFLNGAGSPADGVTYPG